MIHPSHIQPDVELRDYLTGQITVGEDSSPVRVYSDWERPTNQLPTDFVVIYINGDIEGAGMDTNYAKGSLMVSLYCKLNDDGSVKKSRVRKILEKFDLLVEKAITENYHFEYDASRFITPTTPNQTSGYSVTSLNLRWTTTNNFNN